MKRHHILSLIGRCALLLAGVAALASCGTITEDLPPCEHYVRFCYDRNMLSVDAFPTQVTRIHLYLFDDGGKFVTRLTDEREAFGADYRMTLPQLPAGTYRMVAWAGLNERSYACPPLLQPGISTPDDIRVKMLREADGTQNRELDALWHGETTMTVAEGEHGIETIRLTKDTNRFRILVQASDGPALRKEDLNFRISDRNGYLDHDNRLLPDEAVSYLPYYQADADLSGDVTDGGNVSAVVAELNTLRLMEDADARLTVTHRNGEKLVDIDLIRYLLLTKMEGHDMPAQEYLDRQDEYVMIFFLNKDALGHYLLMYIQVNGWTIRPQSGEF